MSILLVGLNHRTAPVELREQFALTGCGLDMALEELPVKATHPRRGNGHRLGEPLAILHEGVILSTCNRLEVYAVAGESAAGWAAIEDFLTRLQGIPAESLRPHLYMMVGEQAVEHLMRVAAGLDSMILGEPQILGQVAQALADAQAGGTSGPILSHLFAQAAHTGKRARTETDISRHTTSVSHAAARLVREELGDLSRSHILIVGAGEMAELAASALQAHGARHFTCINRTYSRAASLAEAVEGEALNWYHLPQALAWADAVITATDAPHIVIQAADVEEALPERGSRALLFVDIAVPRDVEEDVGGLPGVQRYDIDDLHAILDDNLTQREAAIPQVETLVHEEAAAFLRWLDGRQVAPLISDLRRKATALAAAEVERALNRLEDLTPQEQQVINRLAHRIVNKLLHEPTVQLKANATNGDGCDYAQAMRVLFGLGEPSEPNGRDGSCRGTDLSAREALTGD